MRIIFSLFSLGALVYGLWWTSYNKPDWKNKVEDVLNIGHFHTLEIRYTAEQIMESQQKILLKDPKYQYLEPSLKFYPYLLLEVKYSASDAKTKEGIILWDLTDGEMVVNAKDWDKTHGFADCINANVDRREFKIINAIAQRGGVINREDLRKNIHVETDVIDALIETCRRKKLIVQYGGRYRLHLENPKLKITPSTLIEERLVTQPYRQAICVSRRYSLSQIERITSSAFGEDFAIRKTASVYLPVHCIVVQNPDGSLHTSHWNALNGKPLESNGID